MGNLNGRSMRESAIKVPSETVVFGEKASDSPHYYMDFLEDKGGNGLGNDVTEVEQSRHSSQPHSSRGGGSNYAFSDGSTRYLRFSKSFTPVNLWATEDSWRTNTAIFAFGN